MIYLGQKVRDVISGIEGIAIGRCEYITGCNQIGIESPAKDGKRVVDWIDDSRIEIVDAKPIRLQAAREEVGGPQLGPGGPQLGPGGPQLTP